MFFFFFLFLTQCLSEPNSLSVQDNHNKLFLFHPPPYPLSSLSCPLSCSPPIPSPYFTFSNVSITAGHKPPCCECVCVSARGRERETKEDHIKDFPCLLRSNVLPLSVSFSPLMWPVLISGADIAAVPSPLVEKDSFPTEKDALEHSTHTQHTHIHTHTQAPLNSERKRR